MAPISVVSVRDPQYFSEDKTRIRCLARFNHVKGEHLFVAYKYDCEEHGREIWKRCVSGEFGLVRAYDPKDGIQLNLDIPEIPEEYAEFSKFIDKVNEENAKKSFLSVGMLWTSKLDFLVSELLETYFIKCPESKKKFRTLHDKVNACVDFELLTNSMKTRFDNLRVVRNKLAHEWNISLDDAKLKEALHNLYLQDHAELFEFLEDVDFLLQMIFSGSCCKAAITIKGKTEALKQEL
ncbi:hypothetical protein [Vibrio parahaemolyticus]|uniref:hypothetical protein n=1 Tax=Vibrio parahaemolyticus TaxID=670 RepID=UPI00215CD668|nr:hypothetical protein [Vibrio parahaemolyticus]MCR9663886.1 hypothetical protein [Vibrio parahaemolyticus]MCR9679342.1 hypothetical protein [Vibrio parahaemolyticus]